MNLLKKLELQAQEIWRLAMSAGRLQERQKLLKRHRQIYDQYKRHKEWLKAIQQ